MGHTKFFCAGTTEAVHLAAANLQKAGFAFAREPDARITDLLLDIPSFDPDGNLRDGEDPEALFSRLPAEVRIWGGNLDALQTYRRVDLLKDVQYLAENASITADCALKLAAPLLDTTWRQAQVLVIGWGRIGKCLSKMLKATGASVTVCARKASDRALLRAFSYEAAEPQALSRIADKFDAIFNTVPAFMLDCSRNTSRRIAIDLASERGLTGKNILWARGLPGRMAPRASGKLIAQRILALYKEEC